MTIERTNIGEYSDLEELYYEAAKYQLRCSGLCWNTDDIKKVQGDISEEKHLTLRNQDTLAAAFTLGDVPVAGWPLSKSEGAVYLRRIVIAPKYRGKGIMEKILYLASMQAAYKGLHFVRLETWGQNEKLLAYYNHMGFKLVHLFRADDIQSIYPEGTSIALMEFDVRTYMPTPSLWNFKIKDNAKIFG